MNWLIYVAISVFADSLRIYTDNYTSDVYFKGRNAASQKLFFGIIFPIFGILLAICSNIDFSAVSAGTFLLFVLSGLLNAFAGIFYYKALELDDSTNLGIFIQLSPILYLILGWAFLGDMISLSQFIAFFVILIAPLLIIFSSRKRSRKLRLRALFFAFLYVFINVIGNLVFVKADTESLNFIHEIALTIFGIGIGDLLIALLRPQWLRRFIRVYKNSQRRIIFPLLFSATMAIVKTTAYRFALVSAPAVALASVAADSSEPIIIFFMGLILTLIWPRFGREKLNRKSVIVHLIATILVVIGIILLQT